MTKKHYFILLYCLIVTIGFSQEENSNIRITGQLRGTWVNEQDSLAVVEIGNRTWTFRHVGALKQTPVYYEMDLTKTLPGYADQNGEADFLVLAGKRDTIFFEILGLTGKIMSLMHYPSGRRHVYIRKK